MSLETGIGFSTMEDEVYAHPVDHDNGLPKPTLPENSDWDSDESDDERDP